MIDDYLRGYTDPTPGPTKDPVPTTGNKGATRICVDELVVIGCGYYRIGHNMHGNLILRKVQ